MEKTALNVQESYEKFHYYINSLEPPEDGSLVIFPIWHMVRTCTYVEMDTMGQKTN